MDQEERRSHLRREQEERRSHQRGEEGVHPEEGKRRIRHPGAWGEERRSPEGAGMDFAARTCCVLCVASVAVRREVAMWMSEGRCE